MRKISSPIQVTDNDADMRLDRYLLKLFPHLNNSSINKFIRNKDIRLNAQRADNSCRLKPGDLITLNNFALKIIGEGIEHNEGGKSDKARKSHAESKFHSMILAETTAYFVLNKPSGIASQGGTGIRESIDLLAMDAFSKQERPLLVHRLDKETSGLIILAKGRVNAQFLAQAFADRKIKKIYWALLNNIPPSNSGVITGNIGKKEQGGTSFYEKVEFDETASTRNLSTKLLKPTRTGLHM